MLLTYLMALSAAFITGYGADMDLSSLTASTKAAHLSAMAMRRGGLIYVDKNETICFTDMSIPLFLETSAPHRCRDRSAVHCI